MNTAPMSFLLLFLFVFFIIPSSKATKFPALLSLACTPPPNKSLMNNKSIKHLVDNSITSSMTNYSTFHTETTPYNGVLMQCLPDLTTDLCTFCTKNAKKTITKLCPNASSVTAWFDACYLQYISRKDSMNKVTICSNSNQISVQDSVQFELKLEELLLRLRAEIYLTTHYKFSTGDIENSNGSRIYALVKCVQSLSPEECGVCVAKGIEKVYKHCGGKQGGLVATGYCIVRYESYKFFSYFDTIAGGGSNEIGSSGAVQIDDDHDHDYGTNNFRVFMLLIIWGIGVVCFVVSVFASWLLKRSIINKAKVAAFSDEDHGSPGRETSV